ncbi:MAG: aminopeptidase [Anaerolineales bacterium]|nr:aminopeptidase [Anaerolineales bacterium]
MPDSCLVNLARTLVQYSTRVQPCDRVAIIGAPVSEPLMKEVFREVLRAEAHPYPMLGLEVLAGMNGLDEIFFAEANEDQLKHVLQTEYMVRTEFEVMILLKSQANSHSRSNVDPVKVQMWKKARGAMNEIFFNRSAEGKARWALTLYPTYGYAQDADMGLEEFRDYVYRTTFSDQPDPIAAWKNLHNEQQAVVDWLNGRKQVVVEGPNIDMKLSIEGRTFINSDGTNNMPSGEIFTGPVEDSAEGWVKFTYPAIYEGREVSGVKLAFEKGKVVRASAQKNEAFLMAMLDMDEGSRFLGEFAIGTNKMIDRFIKNILFDEKIGGTIHMALGMGYPETGSVNKSAIHWDMICDMRKDSRILVDGDLLYENGEFKI